jgi:hypothetical protein
MLTVLVRHRVANFATWKSVFDEHRGTRKANGSCGERVFRSSVDADEVFVLMEWDDVERARLFVRSVDLSDAMVRAGVIDRPDFWILDEAD